MKKKLLCGIFALCLLLALCIPGYATGSQTCGEGITWQLTDSTLVISGAGKMSDFPDGAPWDAHKDQITQVVFTGGVTYIGEASFKNYDNLTQVNLGDALYEIGKEAFYDCDGLTRLVLPNSFKVFGERCLYSCGSLKAIYYVNRYQFPSFRQSCLSSTKATIYYSEDRAWDTKYIDQIEEAFGHQFKFQAFSGPVPEGPEVPPTDPPTEPPTDPPTEPPTDPPTEPPTDPPTEAPTAPPTQPTAEAEDDLSGDSSKSPDWLGWVFGGLILLLLLILIMNIFTANRKKGRYSKKRRRPNQPK